MEELDDLRILIDKKIVDVKPTKGQKDKSIDIIIDDGTILCISNIYYLAEK